MILEWSKIMGWIIFSNDNYASDLNAYLKEEYIGEETINETGQNVILPISEVVQAKKVNTKI